MAGGNTALGQAKKAKNDEFYTQWADIEKEIMSYYDYNPDVFRDKTVLLPCDDPEWSNFTKFFAQNFERFGLKKLISTSFAFNSKRLGGYYAPSLFEQDSPAFDAAKSPARGKLFVVDRDITGDGRINIEDVHWTYLEGDGDFRSDEVKRLRDEADVVITNPPFSMFREFLAWIVEAGKEFAIIGNQNAITYKEVFPLLKENKIWLGIGFKGGAAHFISSYKDYATATDHKEGMIRVSGVVWFTNIEHGRRHEPLMLMTMKDNIKHSRHKEVRGVGYLTYDNYDAIEVPFTDAIPSDYDGVMGVPISFMDKYCPEQFEIVGIGLELADMSIIKKKLGKLNGGPRLYVEKDGELVRMYERILIRFKHASRRDAINRVSTHPTNLRNLRETKKHENHTTHRLDRCRHLRGV